MTLPRKRVRRSLPEREQVVRAICRRVSNGMRIHEACGKSGITWRKLWNWKTQHAPFQALYARARAASAVSYEDRASKTVQKCRPERDAIQLARLREDHYRWRAKMADPKSYGDKLDVTSGDKPVQPSLIKVKLIRPRSASPVRGDAPVPTAEE